MDRDNAISRGDYLRPWEFIVETKFVDSQFPTLYSTCDQIPRAQLWLTVETRRTRISNSNYVFISDEQHKYRVYTEYKAAYKPLLPITQSFYRLSLFHYYLTKGQWKEEGRKVKRSLEI